MSLKSYFQDFITLWNPLDFLDLWVTGAIFQPISIQNLLLQYAPGPDTRKANSAGSYFLTASIVLAVLGTSFC